MTNLLRRETIELYCCNMPINSYGSLDHVGMNQHCLFSLVVWYIIYSETNCFNGSIVCKQTYAWSKNQYSSLQLVFELPTVRKSEYTDELNGRNDTYYLQSLYSIQGA